MRRRVSRGRVHAKRGRPSKKKETRGLIILLTLFLIGGILGGIGTATSGRPAKEAAAASAAINKTQIAWVVLTVSCVVMLLIIAALYRKRFVDRAERLNDLIEEFQINYRTARTTLDVGTYIYATGELDLLEKRIAERREDLPKWVKGRVKMLPPEQRNIARYYQWWLRDVIDRAKTAAVKDCKGTYKNSNTDKKRIYWEFVGNLDQGCATFDRETVDAANTAAMAVFRASGSFFTPRDPYVTATESRRSSGRSQSMESVLLKVDSMSGKEFERFCADLLRKNGYNDVKLTQASGDQGVDILAEKGGVQYAIQCKCYSTDLGNTPVQEVNAGRAIYGCHVGVVLTNRHFTKGAREAAARTNVLLWDRDTLCDIIRNSR